MLQAAVFLVKTIDFFNEIILHYNYYSFKGVTPQPYLGDGGVGVQPICRFYNIFLVFLHSTTIF